MHLAVALAALAAALPACADRSSLRDALRDALLARTKGATEYEAAPGRPWHGVPPYPGQSWDVVNGYASPYVFANLSVELALDFFTYPKALQFYANQSTSPISDWFDQDFWGNVTTWGPYYQHWNSPMDLPWDQLTIDYKQQRLVLAASLLRGQVTYAHHHMAFWNVPDAWASSNFTPGIGIDCSDMSAFSYNWGLGVNLDTGVTVQGTTFSAEYTTDSASYTIAPVVLFNVTGSVESRFTFDELTSTLQAGDLLYIRGGIPCSLGNPISHVVMSLGNLAYDTNGIDQFLIFDSHGEEMIDSNNVQIPYGPHIRPLMDDIRGNNQAQSYYWQCLQTVVRWI